MTPAYEGDPEPPKLVPPKLLLKEQGYLARRAVAVGLSLGVCLSVWPAAVDAQSVGDVFRRAAPSVVVIRARSVRFSGGVSTTRSNRPSQLGRPVR